MNRAERLGQEKVLPLLIRFSIPAIVGMLVQALYNVVDRIFVGNGVGPLGLAGLTVSFPVMLVQMAFSMLIGLGATALISIRLGEDRHHEAEQIMGNAVGLLVLVSATLTILGIAFLDPMLRLMGASEAVLPYARDYLRIILYGTIFQFIGFGLNHMIRAQGNPKVAMATMLIGAITNIVLDPIFIYAFGWGVSGAAFATVLSHVVSSVWVLSFFLRGKSQLHLNLRQIHKIKWPVVVQIASIGFAPFAMQLAGSLQNLVLNKSLAIYGGDLAISAMGIVFSVNTLFLMPIFGINQGSQPILGFNYGAKKYERVKQTLRYAAAGATILSVMGFLATQLFPRQLVSLFGRHDAELMGLGIQAMRTVMMSFPIIGLQIIGANFFQALGKPKKATFLSLSRRVLLLIPLMLILPRFFALSGVFYAYPVADVGAVTITLWMLMREFAALDAEESKRVNMVPSPQSER
ncbi:MAG TPA: MATE family efflux transporter [Firmicutes bacterium]|nr:MATE family efflux transporter [Bacillota bacterium]